MRRIFLFLGLLILQSQFIPCFSLLGSNSDGSKTSFNGSWLFSRFGDMPDGTINKEPAGIEGKNFNDSQWRKLSIPHDWGIEGPFRKDLPSSTGKLPWAGIGWYRKHFSIPTTERGKLFFIEFDGAMSHAQVWLNGHYLGEWPYGYASFRFDMTPHILLGEDNVIAIRLNNPLNSSRWYPGSGLYRNAWIAKSSPVHIAYNATFVTTPEIRRDQSSVSIKNEVINETADSAEVSVFIHIYDYINEKIVGTSQEKVFCIPAGSTVRMENKIILQNPKFWNLESPNLYYAKTFVRLNGAILDSTTTLFGIRTVQFTSDNGFLLNGNRVPLKGVCNHHDLGILGTAINEKALARQIKLLQEAGCNAIRTSHNPPAPELLDLCDKMGMLVLDEAFDCWEMGKTPNDYSTLFKEWHEKDIRAFVRRDRNHPCVIGWSAGNEVREQGNGTFIQKLKQIFYAEDSTRQVTAGCDKTDAGFNGFQNSVDFFGYNYKPHMYKKFHLENPGIPLYGSETASCVSTYGEYFFPLDDKKSSIVQKNQVSSFDLYAPWWATTPDIEFEGQDKNPFVAGEFVWTGFDYLGEPAPFFEEASVPRSSYFGIFDLCGFKKDRFYLYQARWRPNFPMAHILPHWTWPDRVDSITPVQVYTSGDEAELFLNGISFGRQKKGKYQYRFTWDSVKYSPGLLKVITYKNGKAWATNQQKTAGSAVRIILTPENDYLKSDGVDLIYIPVKIVDREGVQVPSANQRIRFKVSGPAVIAAVGNGDPTNYDSFQSDQYDAFHGQCMLIIRSIEGKNGQIHIVAESNGLESGRATITAKSDE